MAFFHERHYSKTMRIKIETNLLDIANGLGALGQKHLFRAVRRSINRSLPTMRAKSVELVKRDLNLKSSRIRQGIQLNKARGSSIFNIEGSIAYDSIPVPMLEFVRGAKTPIQQKGVKVKRRRKLKIEIKPGRKVILAHAFIQRVRTLQVFKRKNERRLAKQGIHSVAQEVFRSYKANRIAEEGLKKFESEFQRDWDVRLQGLIADVNLKFK